MSLTYSKCNGRFSYCSVMIATVVMMLLLATMTLDVLQRKELKRKASLISGGRSKEMGKKTSIYS